MARAKIPVTVVTGYLGSGKTTLLNKLIQSASTGPMPLKIAVFVNEFGSVGIDGELIKGVAGQDSVIELANGCLCCVVTTEFSKALSDLTSMRPDLDHIVIETSGAADPTSVIKVLWGSPEMGAKYRLDSVVCVVDSTNFLRTSEAEPLALVQASVADVVVLSKKDRCSDQELNAVQTEVERFNAVAQYMRADLDTHIEVSALLGLDAYRVPKFRALSSDLASSHKELISVATSWEGRVSPQALQNFFRNLVMQYGDAVLRTKALLFVENESRPWLIQGVQSWIERSAGPKKYTGPNRLVVLGKNIDPKKIEEAIEQLKRPSMTESANP